MSKIGKFFVNILIVAYAAIAIAVTILLLSYNEYHCSVVGGYTFILVTDDELEPDFEEGSLVIVKETKAKNINAGDNIFLYRRISSSQFEIKYAEVLLKDTSKGEYNASYVLEGATTIDHADVIGSTEDLIVVPHLGTILSILESRYGYLFLIVVVSFIAFLYEIYELIMEIKYGEREEEDEDDEDEEYDYDEDEYEEEEEEIVKPKKATKKVETKKTTSKPAGRTATVKATTKSTTTKTATKKVATKTATPKAEVAKKSTTKKVEPKVETAKKTGTKKATTAKVATTKTTRTTSKAKSE